MRKCKSGREMNVVLNQYSDVQSSYLFKECEVAWMRALVQYLHPKVWLPGDLLFEKSEPAEGLYIVADGRLELEDTTRCNETVLVTAPDMIGEWAMLTKQPHAFSAKVRPCPLSTRCHCQ